MTTERWLPIPGWEGLYEVSDQGRVRSLDRTVALISRWGCTVKRFTRGRIMALVRGRGKSRGWAGSGNYHAVVLCSQEKGKKRWMVHRLVLTVFVGPDPTGGKMDGAHKDGNTCNNHVSNLRWATRRENMDDMPKQGRKIYGTGRWSELPIGLVLAIREATELGLSVAAIRHIMGHKKLSKSTLNKIVNVPEWLERNFGIAANPSGRRAVGDFST